jgi:glucosaminylphosphatidylinositol acyltransferase
LRQSFFTKQTLLAYAVDFLLNVGVLLLAFTLYASMPLALNLLLIMPAPFLYLLPSRSKKAKQIIPKNANTSKDLDDLPLKPFLTTYRGSMMVATCLSILAVDFRIFPRRFAKVETWGTSLMDLGVGSFVFSAGLVAARPILKENIAGKEQSLRARLYSASRHSLPLFILGLIRLYSVKGLDYAEHVTEYGVHWNFFFTLALLPPFFVIFRSAFKVVPSFSALAIIIGVLYQIALEFTGLKAYILTAPRTDFFSKNREGIFSLFGYLAIFLAGQSTGMCVIPRPKSTRPSNEYVQRFRLSVTLTVMSAGWTLLYVLTSHYSYGLGLSVSRRLANLPYILWITAYNCAQIAAFCGIEAIFFPSLKARDKNEERESYQFATSRIINAFNRNGLAIFVIANLLTGIVNLTIPTLNIGNTEATGILLSYAAILTGVAFLLDMYDISIKL